MSTKAASRRPLAAIAAISLAIALLALALLGGSVANATTSPNDSVLSAINSDRTTNASPKPAFLRNGFVDDYAQSAVINYAACGACSDPVAPAVGLNQTTSLSIAYQAASGGLVTDRPARAAIDFAQYDSAVVYNNNLYASVGFFTKGSISYVSLVTVSFTATPVDETRVGTVKLPSKIQVGVPIIPVIAGFSPLPTSDYGFTWIDGLATVSHTHFYAPQFSDLGHQLKVIVEEQNSGFSDASVTSAVSSKVVIGAVHGPATIQVGGARNVGYPLIVNTNGWTPVQPTIQWYRSGAKVVGATGDTYNQTSLDLGKKISVKLTDAAPGYVTGSKSSATNIVTDGPILSPAPFPTITGSPQYGTTLTAHPGSWGPGVVAIKYQWRVDGFPISGATHPTFFIGVGQIGEAISVTVTGSETGYASRSETSLVLPDALPQYFSSTNFPVMNGSVVAGHTLTATINPWTPIATFYTYQWYLDGVAVSGATHSTFKLPTTSSGKSVRLAMVGFRSGYEPIRLLSGTYVIS